MRAGAGPAWAARWLLALWLAGHLTAANAQFKLQQTFMNTTAPGWTLSGTAFLTAPSIDPAGQGWLRLTDATNFEQGLALDTAETIAPNVPVTVHFSYVSWGGSGADGITVFLYDATQNMSGASYGGGLGYCGGAGGYLAIGLDEYGNFSNPGDRCGAASGGPGPEPESLVIRGPLSANNEYVTGVAVAGGIDNPGVSTRPAPKTVIVTLTPATVGYTVTAEFQSAAGQPFQVLFSNVPFPYIAPASLSVGFSGSTGGSTNNHELQGLVAATPDDLAVTMTGPATVLEGAPVAYTLTVTNNGAYPIDAADAPTVTDAVPAGISGVVWTCMPSAGASCTASGAGNLSTSGLTLPVNASVTYTITGTLEPNTACGGTVTNSATADFGSTSTFADPDETNNTAAVVSNISCAVTLVVNPGTLSFGPQTVGVASAPQTITVTGTNAALISNVATSGDFTQTNDCSSALNGTSCTIQVFFAPASEGSRTGTLTITSSAAASPTTVTLGGTGTNSAPSPFAFTTLNNVTPGSSQVSNAITVSGTNVSTTISVSNGAEYSVNGGAYTSTPGVVSPGAQVTVRLTAPATYNTTSSAVLTIGGVASAFTVTTAAPPQLGDVSVTSGGGAVSPFAVLGLAALLAWRLCRRRASALAILAALVAVSGGRPATAADWDAVVAGLYFGGGLGSVTSTLTIGDVTSRLEADGYQVVASELERSSLSGNLYVGYELPRHFAVEAGWSYLGRTRTVLEGVEPPDLEQLLYDASRATRGGGDAWWVVGRYRWELEPQKLSLDFRAGPYRWVTHSDLWFGADEVLDRNDRGWGYTLGLGPHYVLSSHWAVALTANYFASTADNRFWQVLAGVEYRWR
jgi:Outer membrane protein beta-barrel domain/Bacterial lectin